MRAARAEISATPGPASPSPACARESNAVSTEDEPIEDVDDADLDRVIRSGDLWLASTMQAIRGLIKHTAIPVYDPVKA
jgi:hypothetical protein